MQMLSLLAAARVNRIVNAIIDPRNLPQQLKWSQRINRVNAVDEEITARVVDTPMIADIILEDSEAVIYNTGKIQYETSVLPKYKIGIGMNEKSLGQYVKLSGMDPASQAGRAQMQWMRAWQDRTMRNAAIGVAQRIEQVLVMMLCDGVGFTYSRLGIQLTNPSWGLFADLKGVSAVSWDQPATATPVQDMWTLKLIGAERYSVNYDRATMSTAAFRLMIATTEFQNKAKAYIPPQLTYGTNLNLLDIARQVNFAQTVVGIQIEFYDARYFTKSAAGVESSAPFWPLNNVVLTDSTNDGNNGVWDFANAMCMEAFVAQLTGMQIYGDLNNTDGFGPLAYVTPSSMDLNPPGIVHWAVARGWPRKFQLAASAVLNCGTVVDPVATTIPFPA
jgi:hypothetical protein